MAELRITRRPVQSSNIAEIGYDPTSRTLEVQFLNGGVYRYADVPVTDYQHLQRAQSVGKVFAEIIRPHYACVKVG